MTVQQPHPRLAGPIPHVGLMTPRERDIIELIASGLSNDEIAATLFLSINSVKTYIRSAYRKMGVERRPQAIIWAFRHGLGPALPAAS